MKGSSWIPVFLLVTAGAFALRTLGVRRENGPVAREPHPRAVPMQPEPVARAPTIEGERTALPPQPGTTLEAEPASPILSPPQILPSSPLARDVYDVAASFLTELPRVTELLALVDHLASLAVVDPDSVTVQRREDGDLTSARGPVAIGDLHGMFHFDQDGFIVEFAMPLEDGPWSLCSFKITFQEGESGARGSYATLQFHRKEGEDAARHQREVLVGWAVSSDRGGTFARPLTMTLEGDSRQIGGSGSVQPQEFPWASAYTGGFDAWLRLLKASTSR
jgi:hypothetical protein